MKRRIAIFGFILLSIFICRSFCFAETALSSNGKPDDPVFRVGSETIYQKDINPSEVEIKQAKVRYTQEQFNNWYWSYRTGKAFSLINDKMMELFCQNANCKLDEKYVTEWQTFLDNSVKNMGLPQDEKSRSTLEMMFGGKPSNWQKNKALYERYGGKIYFGNLGYYEPVEARLNLFNEMESSGKIEFYNQDIRNSILEYFKRSMSGAIENDSALQKQTGMSNPWERPYWSSEVQKQSK
ncbi:MAG: hypothetical protein AB1755_00065 [Candidatus Omnitrophota bacterium]